MSFLRAGRLDRFWAAIDKQIEELEKAENAEAVIAILNRYGPPSSADAFFAGSGGDASLAGALRTAGWSVVWMDAHYFWCMRAPDGSTLTYIEGDVRRGNDRSRN